ncbi:unnamed protein product [Agarophyton chilense]
MIGPTTVGGVEACAFTIGDITGTVENIIICKFHRHGSVCFVSKLGRMSNEMYYALARITDGLYEGFAVSCDTHAESGLSDHIFRLQSILQVKLIVLLGELGRTGEYGVVEALQSGRITKPFVVWVSGLCV